MYQNFTKERHNSAMETRDHSKNGANFKSHASKRNSLLVFIAFTLFSNYCFGQNINVQQSQQNVNINVPVIEKTVYVDRYRTVYVDKPQPKRVARKLSSPMLLHDYLWVYTEDIGNFKKQSDALEIIQNINNRNPYGRNNWRIPTPGELAVLEANADKIGLGDDIYLATDHANGVLRMVSTGKTVTEQNEENARMAEQRREAEEARIAEQRRKAVEEENRIKELEKYNVKNGNIKWSATNFGSTDISRIGYQVKAMSVRSKKIQYVAQFATDFHGVQVYASELPSGFRLPTKKEAEDLIASITRSERAIINGNVVYKYYTNGGSIFTVPCVADNRGNFMTVRLWLSDDVPGESWAYYALVFPFVEEGCPKPYVSWYKDTNTSFGGFYRTDFDWGFVRCVERIFR